MSIPYSPLPHPTPSSPRLHTPDDHYDLPPSPGPPMAPSLEHLPPGAGRPRFLGAAISDDNFRQSYASSDNVHSYTGSYDDLSVHRLNPQSLSNRGPYGAGPYRDDPYSTNASSTALPMTNVGGSAMPEKRAYYADPRKKSRKRVYVGLGILAFLLLAAAVAIPLYFAVIRPRLNSSGGSSTNTTTGGNGSGGGKTGNLAVVTGGDGSKVKLEDGSEFTYSNKFGGYWYWDEEDPFNNTARSQLFSPPLNEPFKWGQDVVRGVNLGGWLVTEPFIAPALYQKYSSLTPAPIDEYTLSVAIAADASSGGLQATLEEHYKTFITEEDFAQIAGAGLNFVRIPIGYWAIETRDNEPFLAKVSWKYFLKAIEWARKYGIRINLDLHSLPGSQNGWNHSGKLGEVGLLRGPMGLANAQRALDYIRILAEFISQPQYSDVVVLFGIMNEPRASIIGNEQLEDFYYQAYETVRNAGGRGAGHGPFVSFHEGFRGLSDWAGFLPNADRIALDYHPYLCFGDASPDPIEAFVTKPCDIWANTMNQSTAAFGFTGAGEWSLAINDCGLFLNGVGLGTRYEGTFESNTRIGSCEQWTDWTRWTPPIKAALMELALNSMDALQNYFFWTWKIGNSTTSGRVETPFWSYSLGLEQGYMPKDPRMAVGKCGGTSTAPALQPWQTGGAGNDQIPPTQTRVWPPAQISLGGAPAALPTYTAAGPIPTLPAPTFTAAPNLDVGDGWTNDTDTLGLVINAPGCSYLDPWVDPTTPPPSPLCS